MIETICYMTGSLALGYLIGYIRAKMKLSKLLLQSINLMDEQSTSMYLLTGQLRINTLMLQWYDPVKRTIIATELGLTEDEVWRTEHRKELLKYAGLTAKELQLHFENYAEFYKE